MDFGDSIRSILQPGIPNSEILNRITSEEALEKYFRRVFRIGNSIYDAASNAAKFDYEVLEKIGDASLKAIFNHYMYEIMGNVVSVPKLYSNMEKVLLNTENLAYLADRNGFDRFSDFKHPRKTVMETKEDMFESFVGAVVLSGNEFVSRGMGMVLATDWLYTVFNNHFRDRIDPTDPSRYVDFRSQISELWKFNDWGPVNWAHQQRDVYSGSKQTNYNVIGPTATTFPKELRGKVIGWGGGDSKAVAKENAARDAIEKLGNIYKNFETDYAKIDLDRIKKMLEKYPDLLKEVIDIIDDDKNGVNMISIKKVSLRGMHFAQSTVRFNDSHYQPLARARSTVSVEDAIAKSFEGGLLNLKKHLNLA